MGRKKVKKTEDTEGKALAKMLMYPAEVDNDLQAGHLPQMIRFVEGHVQDIVTGSAFEGRAPGWSVPAEQDAVVRPASGSQLAGRKELVAVLAGEQAVHELVVRQLSRSLRGFRREGGHLGPAEGEAGRGGLFHDRWALEVGDWTAEGRRGWRHGRPWGRWRGRRQHVGRHQGHEEIVLSATRREMDRLATWDYFVHESVDHGSLRVGPAG